MSPRPLVVGAVALLCLGPADAVLSASWARAETHFCDFDSVFDAPSGVANLGPSEVAEAERNCKEPRLKKRQAMRETRYRITVVAAQLIDQGAYRARASSCDRKSRQRFVCRGYFLATPHLRCTQRYRVFLDRSGEVVSRHMDHGPACKPWSKAPY